MIQYKKPRAKLQVNEETLNRLTALAQIMCTQKEAAAVMGVSASTLEKFISQNAEAQEAWHSGKYQGRASLRRLLWKQAQTDANQARFLAKDKRWLDMNEKSVDVNVNIRDLSPQEVDARIEELSRRLSLPYVADAVDAEVLD